jgi:hypothetical protein
MMRMHSSHCFHMWPSHATQIVGSHTQLSEQEVIDISSVLLTPGIHYIKVGSVEQGRLLLSTFLANLNCYHDIAYLGLEPMRQDNKTKYLDVYTVLANNGLLEKPAEALSAFLCTQIYCDFLWVEATDALMSAPWFNELEQSMFELQFDKTIPIIVLSYN